MPGSLPPLKGSRIKVCFKPALTAHAGKLLSGSEKGTAVHAASFLRTREIVLEDRLLKTPKRLCRIFAHEVFHFVWLRIGNQKRRSYELLLQAEVRRGARGELGWSAESLKQDLTPYDCVARTSKWRQYACESFCDTAGWAFGSNRKYAEMTLAKSFRNLRLRWLAEQMLQQPLPI
jgi:hypothetical protein